MEQIEVLDLKRMAYPDALAIQEEHFNKLLIEKMEAGQSHSEMKLILCQHEPVFTLGKNGDAENLLPLAQNSGASFVQTNRGGDITYHGPGQLVGYPILDLERLGIGLAKYIELIEEAIILTIAAYGLKGDRLKDASGVWLDVGVPGRTRKICALGIRSSRWVTMHGFAFNINTDLRYFEMINPCGFTDKGVSSLAKELGSEQNFDQIQSEFIKHFAKLFNLEVVKSQAQPH